MSKVAEIVTFSKEDIEGGPPFAVELKKKVSRFTSRCVDDINSFHVQGIGISKTVTFSIDFKKDFGCLVTIEYEDKEEPVNSFVRNFEVFDKESLDDMRMVSITYKDRIIDDLDYRLTLQEKSKKFIEVKNEPTQYD